MCLGWIGKLTLRDGVRIFERSTGMWRNWQTRRSQKPVMVTSWRFKSSHPHQYYYGEDLYEELEIIQTCVSNRPRTRGLFGFRSKPRIAFALIYRPILCKQILSRDKLTFVKYFFHTKK